MNKNLKITLIIILLFSNIALASDTPLSGTFSNAGKEYKEFMKPTLKQRFNLIVTTNGSGQQFFIQCFNKGKVGFGVVSEFKVPRKNVTIDSGSECPAKRLRVELDYEEAFIRTESGWAHLMRSNVYVPISK